TVANVRFAVGRGGKHRPVPADRPGAVGAQHGEFWNTHSDHTLARAVRRGGSSREDSRRSRRVVLGRVPGSVQRAGRFPCPLAAVVHLPLGLVAEPVAAVRPTTTIRATGTGPRNAPDPW